MMRWDADVLAAPHTRREIEEIPQRAEKVLGHCATCGRFEGLPHQYRCAEDDGAVVGEP